jgi:hypothetical protein
MYFWKFLGDWLLKYPEGDGDSLEILGSCGDIDIDWFESGVVDDGRLGGSGGT